MTPLQAIFNWWKSLEDFPREHIAAAVCFRLIPHATIAEADRLFRAFLMEKLPANWHVGRVLAVRAVVDYWFLRDQERQSSTMLLDAVEGPDVELKSLANEALGRGPRIRKETRAARVAWRRLRKTDISDLALETAERNAMLRQWFG